MAAGSTSRSRRRSLCLARSARPAGNERLMRPFSLHERTLTDLDGKGDPDRLGLRAKSTTLNLPVGYCWTLLSIWPGAGRDAGWLCRTAPSRLTNALERKVWRPSQEAVRRAGMEPL